MEQEDPDSKHHFSQVSSLKLKQYSRIGGVRSSKAQKAKLGPDAYSQEMRRRVMLRWAKKRQEKLLMQAVAARRRRDQEE